MNPINEVTLEQIQTLDANKLTKLLHLLLNLEAKENKFEEFSVDVAFNINSADGGEDGKITWSGLPEKTSYLPKRICLFQNKATDLSPGECKEELLATEVKGQDRRLKTEIQKLADEHGAYILFTNRAIAKIARNNRIKSFKEALVEVNHPNALTLQFEVYDANKIKDWTNKYIQAIVQVQSDNGITRILALVTWLDWQKRNNSDKTPFKSNISLQNKIVAIQTNIIPQKVIRATGHSGLGKTRLIFEAFRNSTLKDLVLYYDLRGNDNIQQLDGFIISHQENKNAILIIDNCTYKTHLLLAESIKSCGNFKLITIGFDDNREVDDVKIKFDKEEQRDIVKEIIKDLLGHAYDERDIEYVNKMCEGYPWMAVKFCNSILQNDIRILSQIEIGTFIEKLIFGNNSIDLQEYNIIKGCSVFSAFGFYDDSFKDVINKNIKEQLEDHSEFIRTKIIDDAITVTKYNSTISKFVSEDIIEKRGRFYIVKPTILAVQLAAKWLVDTPEKRIIEIIHELKGKPYQAKFLERFKDLNELDKAKEIVEELWGGKGPFTSAEVLNTEWGSLLFRYVVEVNPEATIKTLSNAFGNYSKADALLIDDGRRNLVWALEKLCFHDKTFFEAAKIMYLFAVSENELIGNNALGQFKQLFHIYLAGTAANLKERLKVIKWGLAKNDEDYTHIAIEAMSSGLVFHNFVRMGGAENQGGSLPLKDYVPSNNEISEYWKQIILYMEQVALSDSKHAVFAKDRLANAIRGVGSVGLLEILIPTLDKIIENNGSWWPAALNALKMTLNYEIHLSDLVKSDMKRLIGLLEPTDLKNQLTLIVGNPVWYDPETDKNGNYIDKQKLKAESLADTLVEKNIDLTPFLKDLLTGTQIQGFNFGKIISSKKKNDYELLYESLKIFKSIETDDHNPMFISGLLAGYADDRLVIHVFNELKLQPETKAHAVTIISHYGVTKSIYLILLSEVSNGNVPIEFLKTFQYGGALNKLTNEEVAEFATGVSAFGKVGNWIGLSYIFMFSHANNEKWDYLSPFAKQIILSSNLLADNNDMFRNEGYHWSESVKRLLSSNSDNDFAIKITKQIVEFCSFKNFSYSLDSYVKQVLHDLFDKYFAEIWFVIGDTLIGEYSAYMHLESMIGTKNGTSLPSCGIAFSNKDRWDIIYDWLKDKPLKAVERLAHMMPFNSINETGDVWHPFAKKIIDNFGNHESVLSSILSNMGSYGTMGSRVPYFVMQHKLFALLFDHDFDNVQNWAKINYDILTKVIKAEKLNDEEYFL